MRWSMRRLFYPIFGIWDKWNRFFVLKKIGVRANTCDVTMDYGGADNRLCREKACEKRQNITLFSPYRWKLGPVLWSLLV